MRRTTTILFGDIVGSTVLWNEDRSAAARLIERHDDIVAQVIGAMGGRIFKHTGDGFAAEFGDPADALGAALRVVREVSRVDRLEVRLGAATGVVDERAGDLFGPTVNLAARIGDLGDGGSVAVDGETATLIASDPVAPELIEVGPAELKGFQGHRVIWRVLEAGDVNLPTLDQPGVGLPRRTEALIGREVEIAELVEMMETDGCVTVIGPGGAGKSSLAIAAADATTGRLAARFVDLAQARTDAEVTEASAVALGVPSEALAAADPDQALMLIVTAAQSFDGIIVIDNCEHVIDAAAEVVDEILTATPAKILATSRERLEISGERLYFIPQLDSSSELFLARASARGVDLRSQRQRVAELCHALDHLPLAIELVAARITEFSLDDLADIAVRDLSRAFSPRRRGHSVNDRHASLNAAMDWSYHRMTDDEQRLARQLSVHPAGMSRWMVPAEDSDVLSALVSKSVIERSPGGHRFRMLETIRQYLAEQQSVDESEQYLDALAKLAVAYTEPQDNTADMADAETTAPLVSDIGTYRLALDHLLEADDLEQFGTLVSNLGALWVHYGFLSDGERYLTHCLAATNELPPTLASRCLMLAGLVSGGTGDLAAQGSHVNTGLSHWPAAETSPILASIQRLSGIAAMGHAIASGWDDEPVFSKLGAALETAKHWDDPWEQANTLQTMASAHFLWGRPVEAEAEAAAAAAVEVLNDRATMVTRQASATAAFACVYLGDLDRATMWAERLPPSRRPTHWEAQHDHARALIEATTGDPDHACRLLAERAEHWARWDVVTPQAEYLVAFAGLRLAQGERAAAAKLIAPLLMGGNPTSARLVLDYRQQLEDLIDPSLLSFDWPMGAPTVTKSLLQEELTAVGG